MKLVRKSLTCAIIFVFLSSVEIFAFDYIINNYNFYAIPNISRPPKGITFQDPVFHTEIVRITDALVDVPTLPSASTKLNYAQAGYPKHDIENADGTLLIIQSYRYPYWHVWNANPPYNKIKDLPIKFVDTKDPDVRWDASDPATIYSTYGSTFLKYNVTTGQMTLLHDFKNDFPGKPISRAYTAEEGDASTDKRYWAFKIRCYAATHSPTWWDTAYVVYDKDFFGKDNGKVISVLNGGGPLWKGAGFISMSPSGKYVWIGDTHYIYPRDFSSIRSLGFSDHADMAISAEGREVVFGFKHRSDALGYWTCMADIETGQFTWLTQMGKGGGVAMYHISANSVDKPGWGLVSCYGPNYPTPPTAWDDLSVYMVELTTRKDPPPRVWRLAHTHTARKGYSDDSFAKINKKGTKVWFGSGWGQPLASGAQYDVYQINLPSTWYKDLMGNLPPTASISATPLSGKPPLTVNFVGSGKDIDGTVVSYSWNFGDGSTSNQQNVSHTYESSGSYTATFKVTDDKGATGNANVTINVLKSDTTPPAPPSGLKIVK
jgi:hypothetical protein